MTEATNENKAAHELETCAACLYFKAATDNFGECRRFPPQMIYAEGNILSTPPRIFPSGWCGEWDDGSYSE